jgi:hypothetical protein
MGGAGHYLLSWWERILNLRQERNHVHPLHLLLLQWTVLDIENVLLEPVARRQDDLPPFPSAPGPPSKTVPKRDDRWWSTSTRGMLKLIALVRLTILEESPVEVIVQSFACTAHAHNTSLQ